MYHRIKDNKRVFCNINVFTCQAEKAKLHEIHTWWYMTRYTFFVCDCGVSEVQRVRVEFGDLVSFCFVGRGDL